MDQKTEEEELSLLEQEIEAKEKILMFGAAKNGKVATVTKQIVKGIDVNSLDHDQNSPIDYAWTNKFYDVVMLLLKADSKFPKLFNLANLDDESAKELKYFVEERNSLYRYIEEGNLQEVQTLVNKSKSKFYFNQENQTAAFVAFKNKKWNILAFFKSIGAEFFDEHEKREVNRLELQHKVELTGAMVSHFPPVPDQHILYLISKSRSQKPVERIKDKLNDFYTKLDEIPEISMIFKVIQHSDYLDIVFDFDSEHVNNLNLLSSKNTRGETNYKEGRLYIAASHKRGERKILGTIAHEITHMAIQILFENECNPYFESDKKGKDEFEKVTRELLSQVRNIENHPSQIIFNVNKSYEVRDHHSELIVTVPQILAEYGDQGREWLQKYSINLFNFFKSNVIPNCQEYVNESPIRKAKIEVKKLNETIGELGKLKKSTILFKNVDSVKDLLNTQNKSIFMLSTRSTFLNMIKALQAIFGEDYTNLSDRYLAFDIVNLIPQITNLMQTFYLDACNTLIIRGIDDSSTNKLTDLLETLPEMFERKPNKKIIFIINPNIEENLLQGLRNDKLLDLCVKQKLKKLYLNDLYEESKEKILSIKVKFQGKKVRLKKLLAADENSRKLITGDIIENLIEGKDIQIGGKIFSGSNLEANFAYIDENINLTTFIYEFIESDDIFVFKGMEEKFELIYHLKEFISNGLIKHEEIANQIQIIDAQCYEINNKRLILTNEMSSESFKEFCHSNCRKKIYLIAVEKNGEEFRFTLQELYNPNFYLPRKFKILIDQDQLKKLLSKFEIETFILSKYQSLDNSLEKRYSNIQILTPVKAKSMFEACVKEQKVMHWFHAENGNKIYFKNSSGFCSDSGLDFRELKTDDEFLITEQDLTNHAVNKKIIIIADNPGMGKSTTLTKLYESPVIADTHWIIRINLKEHISSIKKMSGNVPNVDTLITFLQLIEPNFKSELTQAVFKSAMSIDGKLPTAVLFAFDGFDEILDADIRFTVMSLLKYLKNDTRSKIWITTRLHYKNVLENELKTFAFQFEPIDEQHKRIYLQTYLQDRLKLIFERDRANDIFDLKNNSKMHIYTEKFLKHMKHIFTENVSPFIGTPLQLYLMTENSVEHFKNWIDQSTPDPNFSYLGNNILKVFENFIDGKYEIYYKKQNILEDVVRKKERENTDEYHKALAESLTQSKPLSKMHENVSPLAFLIGLIQSHDGKHVEFIHYTFREYFVALSVIKNILSESSDLEQKSKYLIDILEKAEFKVVRNFLDIRLKSINLAEIPKDNIEYFIKDFILLPPLIDGSFECRVPRSLKKCFKRALEERNKNILRFMVYCCECYLPELSCVDLLQALSSTNSVFYWTVYYNDVHIFEIVHKLIKKLPLESKRRIMYKNFKNLTRLDVIYQNWMFPASKVMLNIPEIEAINRQCKVVKMLFTKLNEIFCVEEQKQFFSTMNGRMVYESVFYLAARRDNIKLLKILLSKSKELSLFKELLMMKDSSSRTGFLVATEYGSSDLFNLVIAEMNEVLSIDEQRQIIIKRYQNGNNVLHLAAKSSNIKLVNLLLNESKRLSSAKELLMNQNSSLQTVLHIATESGSKGLLNLLIKKMNEILSSNERRQIIMKLDENSNNVFHLAAMVRNTEVMNMLLNESKKLSSAKELLMNQNSFLETVFHVATNYGRPAVLNLLIKEMNEILSTDEQRQIIMKKDLNGNIALHSAVRVGRSKSVIIWIRKMKEIFSLEEMKIIMIMNNGKNILQKVAKNCNKKAKIILETEMNVNEDCNR